MCSGIGCSEYRGVQNNTVSGRTCARWDSQSPHKHTRTTKDFPNSDLKENYCRNPDGEATIWCFTTDKDVRWELCYPIYNEYLESANTKVIFKSQPQIFGEDNYEVKLDTDIKKYERIGITKSTLFGLPISW